MTYSIGKNEKKYKIRQLHFFTIVMLFMSCLRMALAEKYSKDIIINLVLHRVKDVKVLEPQYFEYPSSLDVDRYYFIYRRYPHSFAFNADVLKEQNEIFEVSTKTGLGNITIRFWNDAKILAMSLSLTSPIVAKEKLEGWFS